MMNQTPTTDSFAQLASILRKTSNQVKMGFTGLNRRTINLLKLIIIFGMNLRVKEG
jgi:hypothetical protein